MFISESQYGRTHEGYKGIFKNLGGHEDMEHLKGSRTYLTWGKNGTCLMIEGLGLNIIPDGVETKIQAELNKVWIGENKIMDIKKNSDMSYYVLYHSEQKNEYIMHLVYSDISGIHYGRYLDDSLEYAINAFKEL